MPLSYDVFVAPIIPTTSTDVAPGESVRTWSPISATLISGTNDAVLVDPLLTIDQAWSLVDWVTASGKNLTSIYATHGHGDHWFGASILLERFPQARFVAMPAVVERMNANRREAVAASWVVQFPGQIPDRVVAAPLSQPTIELEGEELRAIDLGHTDTDNTTCLHVPSIGLVVAGDSVYNGVHQYLVESGGGGRDRWLAALDKIEALQPRAVVAGHKRADRPDDPADVEATRQYIRDFDEFLSAKPTPRELYDAMFAKHSTRINPGMLWASANALAGAQL
jgi:glyoxylase-like metal-dependent hydrolase (beta-lactamase superfamily II)